jgi:N-acetylornithine carbamoyltransferase
MRHFYNLAEETSDAVGHLLELAGRFRSEPRSRVLDGRQFALLFLAPSLRTRCSFEVGIRQLGGGVTTLEPTMLYGLEMGNGVRMDGDRAEHVRDAVRVLSRYYAGLGLRVMAEGTVRDLDLSDYRFDQVRRNATVPVFNMESAMFHPCQALADLLTIQQALGDLKRRRITLTWAPHPRALPTAVPNSVLLAAAQVGMEVTLARPEGFDLDAGVVARARELADAGGGEVRVTADQPAAMDGAEVVYAKSWGALARYEAAEDEQRLREAAGSWTVDARLMKRTSNAWFMHCLPVRRNVVVTDAVLDSDRSLIIEQAENRLHAQKAVLSWLYG